MAVADKKFFLHATWVPEGLGYLFIWAEVLKGKEMPVEAVPPLHPFSASSAQVRAALSPLTGNSMLNASKLTINIPSTAYPMPSPEISIFMEKRGGKMKLRQWAVEGVALQPYSVIETISKISETKDAVLCQDFRYWQEAAKFALSLLARQKFFPSMVKRGGYYAVWKPAVEDAEDKMRFNILSSSIPCFKKRGLLSNFLFSIVDSTIRKWAADESGEPSLEEMTTLEKWHALLKSPKNLIAPFNRDVENLSKAVEIWAEPLRQGVTPFRTCFKLEPPKGSAGKWPVSFHLQDNSDHSLMVEANEIWKESSDVFRFLDRRFKKPQERLLSDLGRASKIFKPLEKCLLGPRPSGCYLSTEDAYRFLSEYAWLLKESGFGALLPSWWDKKNQLGVYMKFSSSESTGLLSLQSLVNFDWHLAIGNERLSLEEFERLARLKVPLVKVRGKWVEIKRESVQETIDQFNKMKNCMSVAEALRLSFGVQANIPIPITNMEASGELENLIEGLDSKEKIMQIGCPADFNGVLRPYQQKGVSWLAFLKKFGFGACLADDMGLGKTIQLIALLLHTKMKPTLLICPTSVIGNWCREISRFAPSINVLVHHGLDRPGAKRFKKESAKTDVVITSYAIAHKDSKIFSSFEWPCIALDEAQNIKNHFSKQAIAIKKFKAGFRVALTGTPVENRLSELWSIFDFLNPSYLGGYEFFRKSFAIPIERYKDKEATASLRSIVQPFVLRRLKTDRTIISDLPKKVESKVFCNLTKEQATLYEAVVKSSLENIEESEGIKRKGAILAALTKLKQVCNHPALFMRDNSALQGRSGKLERLREMAEEILEEDYRALIFTQYAEMGKLLVSYLQNASGEEVLFLYGGTPAKMRDTIVQRFQNEPQGPKLFVLSLKAGGFGLNLTRANHVFHFDRWWNPAVENQATDRAFRIGQKSNVQVYKFVTLGTVEEKIDALIEHKKEIMGNVISAGDSLLTEMSTEQLREIFSLRREFVYSD